MNAVADKDGKAPRAARTPARSARSTRAATRAAILDAAIAVIARHSLSGTTIERVAAKAKVATGTIILRFKSKEGLLVELLDHLGAEFERARREAIACGEGDPVEALDRMIRMSFDPAISDPTKIVVWYAFWGEAGARSIYAEHAAAIDDKYFADTLRLCESVIARGGYTHIDAEAVAIGFLGLLDYLWQEIMVSGPGFDRNRAVRVARAYLASIFPREFGPRELGSSEFGKRSSPEESGKP